VGREKRGRGGVKSVGAGDTGGPGKTSSILFLLSRTASASTLILPQKLESLADLAFGDGWRRTRSGGGAGTAVSAVTSRRGMTREGSGWASAGAAGAADLGSPPPEGPARGRPRQAANRPADRTAGRASLRVGTMGKGGTERGTRPEREGDENSGRGPLSASAPLSRPNIFLQDGPHPAKSSSAAHAWGPSPPSLPPPLSKKHANTHARTHARTPSPLFFSLSLPSLARLGRRPEDAHHDRVVPLVRL